jgi:hypothetical protein
LTRLISSPKCDENDAIFDYEKFVALKNADIMNYPEQLQQLRKKLQESAAERDALIGAVTATHARQIQELQTQISMRDDRIHRLNNLLLHFKPIVLRAVSQHQDTVAKQLKDIRAAVVGLQMDVLRQVERLSDVAKATQDRLDLFARFVRYAVSKVRNKVNLIRTGHPIQATRGSQAWGFFLLSGDRDPDFAAKAYWQQDRKTVEVVQLLNDIMLGLQEVSDREYGPVPAGIFEEEEDEISDMHRKMSFLVSDESKWSKRMWNAGTLQEINLKDPAFVFTELKGPTAQQMKKVEEFYALSVRRSAYAKLRRVWARTRLHRFTFNMPPSVFNAVVEFLHLDGDLKYTNALVSLREREMGDMRTIYDDAKRFAALTAVGIGPKAAKDKRRRSRASSLAKDEAKDAMAGQGKETPQMPPIDHASSLMGIGERTSGRTKSVNSLPKEVPLSKQPSQPLQQPLSIGLPIGQTLQPHDPSHAEMNVDPSVVVSLGPWDTLPSPKDTPSTPQQQRSMTAVSQPLRVDTGEGVATRAASRIPAIPTRPESRFLQVAHASSRFSEHSTSRKREDPAPLHLRSDITPVDALPRFVGGSRYRVADDDQGCAFRVTSVVEASVDAVCSPTIPLATDRRLNLQSREMYRREQQFKQQFSSSPLGKVVPREEVRRELQLWQRSARRGETK